MSITHEIQKALTAQLAQYNRERDQNAVRFEFWRVLESMAKKEKEKARLTLFKELPQADTLEVETDNFNIKKTTTSSKGFELDEFIRILAEDYDVSRPVLARVRSKSMTKTTTRTVVTIGEPEG